MEKAEAIKRYISYIPEGWEKETARKLRHALEDILFPEKKRSFVGYRMWKALGKGAGRFSGFDLTRKFLQ